MNFCMCLALTGGLATVAGDSPQPHGDIPPAAANDGLSASDQLVRLAVAHLSGGRFYRAEPLLHEAMLLVKESGAAGTPQHAATAELLGVARLALGDMAAADSAVAEALAAARTVYGEDHPTYRNCVKYAGLVYLRRGALADAERAFKDVLSFHEQASGPNHLSCADDHSNLSLVYIECQQFDRAERALDAARAIREKTGPLSDYDRMQHQSALGRVRLGQGQFAKADELLRAATATATALFGPNHYCLADILLDTSELYYQRGEFDQATAALAKCISIYEVTARADGVSVGLTLLRLSRVQLRQGKLADAEVAGQRAVAILERQCVANSPRLAEGRQTLVDILTKQGKVATGALRQSTQVVGKSDSQTR